ncbi:MAG: putative flavin-nucleotide-binding protein [Microbacteriaceae bacterium]|nr:putative flavin-nucleotide-binding protein [Microbacteriaceae bacterium]
MTPDAPTRTTPTRMGEKYASNERVDLDALLADVRVGHFAFVVDGQPNVLPSAIAADDAGILLHGSSGSRWLRLLATGIPVALAVTALDALVVARSAFESSMHFRSAVIFGSCAPVPDHERVAALDRVTEALIPGRVAELRPPSTKELAATLILRMTIEEWSLKVSAGWPEDEAADVAGGAWAGVLPTASGFTAANSAPDLAEGIPVPDSVKKLLENRATGYSPA